MLWYLCKKVLEILVDIKLVSLGRLYNAVQYSTGFSSVYGIDQLPVFLSNTKRPDCLFGQVVIKRYLRISKKSA